MNRKIVSSLAACAALSTGAASAFAGVSFSNTIIDASSAWQASFGEGETSLAFTGGTVSNEVTSAGFVHSFAGDGKVLEGFGLYVNGSGASGSWTIALIDYGAVAPIRDTTGFNSVTGTVFADTFTNISFGSGRQLYFDFDGASRVVLQSDHQYGLAVFASGGSGSMYINRAGDVYAGGSLHFGAIGSFVQSPLPGPRTANFALYTSAAPVPEPSAFAALAGLAALGCGAMRRRRRG